MVGSKFKWSTIILYCIAVLILLAAVFPYIYMILQSLANWDQVDKTLIPSSFTFRSYVFLFKGGPNAEPKPWAQAFFNSLIVTLSCTILMMFTGLLVAYALSKLKFKGKNFINNTLIFQMFFPSIILLIPSFIMLEKFHWYDTYWAMILPKSVSLWAIFMYSSFFMSIPDEIIESAKMDGANNMTILFRIIAPMSASISTIVFLFIFMERWIELLWDMVMIRSEELFTLNVLLAQMFQTYQQYPGAMYGASVILTLPIIILFIAFSNKIKEGIQFVLK